MSLDTLLIFVATTFVVVLSPGPAAIAVSAASASSGFRSSVPVVLGIAAANVVYFVLSATGISALIIGSSELFAVVKWVGVAYLVYLGLGALLSRSGPFSIPAGPRQGAPAHRQFLKGFVLEMANPKALLYFAALLSQFIDPTQAVLPQFVAFGLLTLALDLLIYGAYGALGHVSGYRGLKPWLVRWINRSAGAMLLFAGAKMATLQR